MYLCACICGTRSRRLARVCDDSITCLTYLTSSDLRLHVSGPILAGASRFCFRPLRVFFHMRIRAVEMGRNIRVQGAFGRLSSGHPSPQTGRNVPLVSSRDTEFMKGAHDQMFTQRATAATMLGFCCAGMPCTSSWRRGSATANVFVDPQRRAVFNSAMCLFCLISATPTAVLSHVQRAQASKSSRWRLLACC